MARNSAEVCDVKHGFMVLAFMILLCPVDDFLHLRLADGPIPLLKRNTFRCSFVSAILRRPMVRAGQLPFRLAPARCREGHDLEIVGR